MINKYLHLTITIFSSLLIIFSFNFNAFALVDGEDIVIKKPALPFNDFKEKDIINSFSAEDNRMSPNSELKIAPNLDAINAYIEDLRPGCDLFLISEKLENVSRYNLPALVNFGGDIFSVVNNSGVLDSKKLHDLRPGNLLSKLIYDGSKKRLTVEQCQFIISKGGHSLPAAVSKPEELFLDYKGNVQNYVTKLNESEKQVTEMGYTFRQKERSIRAWIKYVDPNKLKNQALIVLKLYASEEFKKILGNPVTECFLIDLKELRREFPEFESVKEINLGTGDLVKLEDSIRIINDIQSRFCSVGIDVAAYMNVKIDKDLFTNYFQKRDEFLSRFKIETLGKIFLSTKFEQIKSISDVAKILADNARKMLEPSAENLENIKNIVNQVIPEEYQIPDVPNFPNPIPEANPDLKTEYEKKWSGLEYGSADRLGTYASASLKIKGGRTAKAAEGRGEAGVWFFKKQLTIASAYAQARADLKDGLNASYEFRCVGLQPSKKEWKQKAPQLIIPSKERPEEGNLFKYETPREEFKYSQTFVIVVVPVVVSVGAYGTVRLDVEAGLSVANITAKITPSASLFAEASGGVGGEAAGFSFSAGVAARLQIIKASIPVVGNASAEFAEGGLPNISLSIISELEYTLLSGSILAFVTYPMPYVRWCSKWKIKYPCDAGIESKRAEKELYSWAGEGSNIRILNWGMEISSTGVRYQGNMVTQAEMEEASGIRDDLLEQEMRAALQTREKQLFATTKELFELVANDLRDRSTQIGNDALAIEDKGRTLKNTIYTYQNVLDGI
ncbi:MAG: hypothetical protein HQK51_07925 [Oligoflexia bacterium]|nr:hypothetical protein [Oligoflexia bacterium]